MRGLWLSHKPHVHNLQLPNQIPFAPTSFILLPVLPELMVQLNLTPYINREPTHPKDSTPSREDVPHRKALTGNGRVNKLRMLGESGVAVFRSVSHPPALFF